MKWRLPIRYVQIYYPPSFPKKWWGTLWTVFCSNSFIFQNNLPTMNDQDSDSGCRVTGFSRFFFFFLYSYDNYDLNNNEKFCFFLLLFFRESFFSLLKNAQLQHTFTHNFLQIIKKKFVVFCFVVVEGTNQNNNNNNKNKILFLESEGCCHHHRHHQRIIVPTTHTHIQREYIWVKWAQVYDDYIKGKNQNYKFTTIIGSMSGSIYIRIYQRKIQKI